MPKINRSFLRRLTRDENGATAIEYGLIAAGIAVVIIAAIALAGGALQNTFNTIANGLGFPPGTTPTATLMWAMTRPTRASTTVSRTRSNWNRTRTYWTPGFHPRCGPFPL